MGAVDVVITDRAYAFTQKVNFSSCGLDPSSYVTSLLPSSATSSRNSKRKALSCPTLPGESYQMITEFNYKKSRRPIYPPGRYLEDQRRADGLANS